MQPLIKRIRDYQEFHENIRYMQEFRQWGFSAFSKILEQLSKRLGIEDNEREVKCANLLSPDSEVPFLSNPEEIEAIKQCIIQIEVLMRTDAICFKNNEWNIDSKTFLPLAQVSLDFLVLKLYPELENEMKADLQKYGIPIDDTMATALIEFIRKGHVVTEDYLDAVIYTVRAGRGIDSSCCLS